MNPSWYDLLDVERDASADEIRSRWRAQVADLDPTDRRFAVLNRAARVLLDPVDRAAYDEELAGAEVDDPPDEEPPAVTLPAPAPTTPDESGPVEPTGPVDLTGPPEPEPAEPEPAEPEPAEPEQTGDQRSGLLGVVLLGLASLALVVVAVLAWTQSNGEEQLAADLSAARSAAEQAVVPILSYDATDLEAGRSSAVTTMTPDFAEEYEALFDGVVSENAPDLGTQAQATFLASGLVRADDGVDRVQVLVFVDQTVTNDASAEPRTFSNQVTVTMQRDDDRWLVDDLETTTG